MSDGDGEPKESIVRHIHTQENPSFQDSVEVGPANARLKVYFNANDLVGSMTRLSNAFEVLKKAREMVE